MHLLLLLHCWWFVPGTEISQLVFAAFAASVCFPPWAAQSVLVMPFEPRVASFLPAVDEGLSALGGDFQGTEGSEWA